MLKRMGREKCTTIVGSRAYASHILPSKLGKRFEEYFGENIEEELDVVGTDNFI